MRDRVQPDVVDEARWLLRPREREVRARAGDAHVEQPPLLGHLLVRLGLADRQQALLHCRQEDRVPFEPLRPMVGQQVDARAVRGRLGCVASIELGQELGCTGGVVHPDQVGSDVQQQLE